MATQAKPEIAFNADAHVWQVQVRDSKGNTVVRDKETSIEIMEEGESVKVYLTHSKDAPRKRVAAVSLLSRIMEHYYDSFLSAWQGTADPHKGIPNELKTQFQDCETKYFEQFLERSHPLHDTFLSAMPVEDMKGNPLTVAGKLNPRAQFQAFLTAMRKEPTYGNSKTTVLGYFAYIGKLPVGDDGRIIPPEVMAVMVRNARIIEQADTSYKGRLAVLWRVLVSDSEEGDKPTDEDLPAIEAMLSEMLAKAKSLKDAAATRATQQPKPTDVAGITDESIRKAQESASAGFKVVH